MAKAQAGLAIESVAQPNLTALFVVAVLSQAIPLIGAGDIGVEVGIVVGHRQRLMGCFSFQTPSRLDWAFCSGSAAVASICSKLFQKAFELNRTGGKPQRVWKILRRYHSATSVFGPVWQMR